MYDTTYIDRYVHSLICTLSDTTYIDRYVHSLICTLYDTTYILKRRHIFKHLSFHDLGFKMDLKHSAHLYIQDETINQLLGKNRNNFTIAGNHKYVRYLDPR